MILVYKSGSFDVVLCCMFFVSEFSYYFSSVSVAEWPPFGKQLFNRLTICSLCILTVILFISRSGFEGLILVLIASGPDLCILFTFRIIFNICFL